MQHSVFALQTLPSVAVTEGATIVGKGLLQVDCVTTESVPDKVFIVLRMNELEIPLDPAQHVDVSRTPAGGRKYTVRSLGDRIFDIAFLPAPDPSTYSDAKIPEKKDVSGHEDHASREDIDAFEGILEQYSLSLVYAPANTATEIAEADRDMRGRLVLVDNESGAVVGSVDATSMHISEDPSLRHGSADEPVIVEISEEDESALQAFVRAVPHGQGDLITESASLLSRAITGGTTLFLSALDSASDYYIKHSTPNNQDEKAQSKMKEWVSSPRTAEALMKAKAVSGKASQYSSKTMKYIDTALESAFGMHPRSSRAPSTSNAASAKLPPPPSSSSSSSLAPRDLKPPLPPRSRSRSTSPAPSSRDAPPPAYHEIPHARPDVPVPIDSKLQPPPQHSTHGRAVPDETTKRAPPSPLPPRAITPTPGSSSSTKETVVKGDSGKGKSELKTTEKFVLSAMLLLNTLDAEMNRVLDKGGQRAVDIMGHKYGDAAAANTALFTGTARNAALIYVDVRGVGRRALLKKVGKTYIKSKVTNK